MRTRTLLSTAAAVLLIGAGTANAQSAKDQAAPERAPAAQRNAPAEKVAPSMNAGEHKTPAETTGQGSSESKSGGAMDKSGASSDKSGTTGAASESGSDQNMKSGKSASDKSDMKGKSDTTGAASNQNEMKSGGKAAEGSKARSSDQNESKGSTARSLKNDEDAQKNAEGSKSGSERNAGTASKSTTGQGAGAAAKLSTEQRTKITTIIKKQDVKPVNLDISVRVGARVPDSVHFYPVPTQVVEVYPEWRGYYFILVSGDILIIDPSSHEIVAVLAV